MMILDISFVHMALVPVIYLVCARKTILCKRLIDFNSDLMRIYVGHCWILFEVLMLVFWGRVWKPA